jgi:Fe-S-cluster containining protein
MTLELFFNRHSRITRSLKKFILDHQQTLSPDIFSDFLFSLSEELQKFSALLQQVPCGVLRAQKLHELVEKEISLEADISVSCKKGCSSCCHMEVEITNYETELLALAVKNGFAIDRERLSIQSERNLQDPQWRDPSVRTQSRCVFLDEQGACGIYPLRPVMCRRHSVTSPAKNCESLSEVITLRYFPRVDLMISAANEDPELRIGPLAKMLQIRLQY